MIIKSNSGYTLVEIILAIAIMGLVVVPVFSYMTNSGRLITYADEREMAIWIAQQRMEFLKSQGYGDIDGELQGYVDVDNDDELVYVSASNHVSYDYNKYPDYKLYENIDDSVDHIKKIIIRIKWDDNNKEVDLHSKIADR